MPPLNPTLSLKKQTLGDALADERLTSETVKASSQPNRAVEAIVLFDGVYYRKAVPLLYKARQGRSGTAKTPRRF